MKSLYFLKVSRYNIRWKKMKGIRSMLIDCHNHSLYSFDGSEKIEDICSTAEALGLSVFALTDHCDMIGGPTAEALKVSIAGSVNELCVWRESHQSPCRMLCGIELGDPLENPALAEEMIRLAPYDVIIGSIHTDGVSDYYFGNYSDATDQQLHESLERYFLRQCEMADWGKFDVLAHMTYPLRYIVGDYGRSVRLERYSSLIDRLFRTIIKKEIVLEINTSGLRQKIGVTLPDQALLTRYRELGGRLITLGSDAHTLKDMAFGIEQTEHELARLGFTELTWFEKRQMRHTPLPAPGGTT